MAKAYISKEVLDWYATIQGGSMGLSDGWARPYDYLNIAFKILETHEDQFELIDCVSNLKRAINHRIKKISSDYQFKKLTSFGFAKGDLDKLNELGAAKPTLINQIHSLRNEIEHKFDKPPKLERCTELADFTWYFLKSTDELCRVIPRDLVFNKDYVFGFDSEYWLNLSKSLRGELWGDLNIRGVINRRLISDSNAIGLEVTNFEAVLHDGGDIRFSERIGDLNVLNSDTMLYVQGVVSLKSDYGAKIIKSFFCGDRHG